MATNLTSDELRAIQSGFAANGGNSIWQSPDGYTYQKYTTGGIGDTGGMPESTAYYRAKTADFANPGYVNSQTFDAGTGNYISDVPLNNKSNWLDNQYLPFALMAGGMGAALAGGAGAAGAAGQAGGGAGTGTLGAVDTGAVGGGAGAGAAGDIGTMGAVPMTTVGGYTIPGTMSGIGAGTAGAGAGVSGLLTSLGVSPGTASTIMGLLGPAATALGAWAGSKGVKQTQTDTKSINPMLNPYVYGTGQGGSPGLLGYTNQMLDQGMSPQGQAGYQSIMSKGMGLLNQPVAQNGFAQFTKGKY